MSIDSEFTLKSIMGDHTGAEIVCAMTGRIVRHIAVNDGVMDFKSADGTQIGIPMDSLVRYQPGFMDRGQVLIGVLGHKEWILFCTEYDIVTYEDGSKMDWTPR